MICKIIVYATLIILSVKSEQYVGKIMISPSEGTVTYTLIFLQVTQEYLIIIKLTYSVNFLIYKQCMYVCIYVHYVYMDVCMCFVNWWLQHPRSWFVDDDDDVWVLCASVIRPSFPPAPPLSVNVMAWSSWCTCVCMYYIT